MDAIPSYTCISCHVAFKNSDLQRQHYRSDWHRYNLKRKVADLPPVSAETFEEKVLNQRQIDSQAKQDKSVYCEICRKSFGNQNSYDNHLNSKRHRDNVKSYVPGVENTESAMEEEVEELDSDEWEEECEANPLDSNKCMFCLHDNKNFIKNLEHMTTCHSFFIPDVEFCVDVYGLLHYLSEKICEGFMCLWCNEKGKTFHSAEAARKHMLDKGHCRMLHEGAALAEYTDYYDYSSSYPDSATANPDEEVKVPEQESGDFELVLPSGATVGHRSLWRYYKQSLNPSSLVVSDKSKKLHHMMASYKGLGWKEEDREVVAKRARDIHYMKRVHAKLRLSLGVKANKLHKYMRVPMN